MRIVFSKRFTAVAKFVILFVRVRFPKSLTSYFFITTFLFVLWQPANEISLKEVLCCFWKNFLGDPSSLRRTTSLLEILGSVTVSMVDMYGGHNVGSI